MKQIPIKQSAGDNVQSDANPNSQSNSPLINKQTNTELIKTEVIDGTPFVVNWTPEKQWFAAYKAYQITKECATKEEVIEEINYNTWHIILLMIQICIVETDNLKSKLAEEANKKNEPDSEGKRGN